VDYDLSRVMFITTANIRFGIPLPLQDRMEIIELPGICTTTSGEIAKRHIIPKQLKEHGLEGKHVSFTDAAIDKIIADYTREAGVRNLEREIASTSRKIAKDIVSSRDARGAGGKRGRVSGMRRATRAGRRRRLHDARSTDRWLLTPNAWSSTSACEISEPTAQDRGPRRFGDRAGVDERWRRDPARGRVGDARC